MERCPRCGYTEDEDGPEHMVYVELHSRHNIARCGTCGWTGTKREEFDLAVEDAHAHLRYDLAYATLENEK